MANPRIHHILGDIGELLDACQLLSSLAVVKCEAHTKSNDSISRDNALADLTELVVSVHVKLCPSLNAYPHDVALP